LDISHKTPQGPGGATLFRRFAALFIMSTFSGVMRLVDKLLFRCLLLLLFGRNDVVVAAVEKEQQN
jgi:hypothetical protein